MVVMHAPHPDFRAEDAALVGELEVGLIESLLGFERTVQHPNGTRHTVHSKDVVASGTGCSGRLCGTGSQVLRYAPHARRRRALCAQGKHWRCLAPVCLWLGADSGETWFCTSEWRFLRA